MDVNSRDPSQNIIPFRIKGVDIARFDISGNLGIGTTTPTAKLDIAGSANISGNTVISGTLNINNISNDGGTGITLNGIPIENKINSAVVINMDSQPAPATALNRQKKQSIPLAVASTLSTSDVVAKMSGVSVGKSQSYGLGPAQMASYGNIVVAVGVGTNSIAYSLANPPTASSWVGIPNSANTFTTQGRNIAYANGTWVAVGEGAAGNNSIAYSTMTPPVASSWVGVPNNTSFNAVTTTNTFSTRGNDIAYGNGAWVAVGQGINSIAYSLANPPTAESWVGITTASTNFGTAGLSITFGNGTWVATGEGTNGISYSTRTPPTSDSWVVVPLTTQNDASGVNTFGTLGFNIAFANGVWLAAGQGTNTLCYSVENPPIAGSWMPITASLLFGTIGRSIAYGNGTWVACGESGALLAYSTSRIPHSSSWVSMKGPTPSSSGEQINHVAFNTATNIWYFTGDISSNCMFYSTQTPPVPTTWVGVPRSTGTFTTQAFGAVGITTNAFTSPINVARLDNKVTFPANRMLAVGGGGADVLARSALTPAPAISGTISYSDDDGATWAMVPGGATNAMFSSAADISANTSFGVGGSLGANAVAWNGEKWVAAGNGRTNSLAFSDDGGMTWTGVTGKSVFSVEARDVAWNGRMWVAVGRGAAFSTAYSYDGVTWMGPIDASGAPINVFSLDIAGPSASMSDISGGGNRVVWSGKTWVATGTRTLIAGSSPAAYYTIAYSTDGKTWTGVPESGATSTGFDMYAHGVAWNGRNYVATGRGTVNTLVTFTDAASSATWQGLGNSVFSIWGRGITWGAKRWMATGRGTNTVAYSTNGRNWQGCGANVFKPMRRFMAMGDTGVYTTVPSGQPQRGVAFSYSDDGVTWDAPVVNQAVEFFDQSTPLYAFTTHTFNNADKTGRIGPTLQEVKTKYLTTDPTATWTQDAIFLNMTNDNGIQLWRVPVTGVYRIRAVGAAAPTASTAGGRGIDITTTTNLIKGEIIQILVGQRGVIQFSGGGGGGTFVVRGTQTPIIVAGGGGGPHYSDTYSLYSIPSSDASSNTSGNSGFYIGTFSAAGGTSGGGGVGGQYGGGGGGLTGNGGAPTTPTPTINTAGNSFISGGLGGLTSYTIAVGGFGGGAGTFGQDGGGGGGGGYSGGGGQGVNSTSNSAGGGGGSFAISTMTVNGYNTVAGSVTITLLTTFGDLLSSSTLFTNNTLLTNAITDTKLAHTALMFSADGGASWARVPGTSDTEANGGTGMTVANGGCYSLAANPARTRFLAGGGDSANTTRKVYFSNDGFNWRNSISSPNATQMALAQASLWVGGIYNRWLIGGNDATTNANGRIMRSGDADAVAAWATTSPATYTSTIVSCFAANTDFSVILAGVTSGNVIYRSVDGGANWTTVIISGTPTGSVTSIAFSPSLGRWVAVGGGSFGANTIIYSTDATGTAWIAPPLQAKTAATAIFKNGSEATRVIWDAVGGRFLVGGWNGASTTADLTNVFGLDATSNNNPGYTMAYSADGINWTPVTVRSSDASSGSSVSGPFLTRCREIMALDTAGDFTPINTGYSVTWNSYANRFVATGNGTCPVVYSSDGGVTWTPANQQPPQQAIAVAGGASAAASTTSVSPLTYTIDGKTWSQGLGAKEIFGTGAVNAVEYGQTSTAVSPNGGRIWVAGGAHTSGTSCLAFSQNGIRWTAITGATTMITNVRTIVYAPAEQLISTAGAAGANNAAITATSGIGNGVWVAGGDTTNSLIFSYDGISWSEVPNSLTILLRCNAIAFGNGLFVAGGVASSSGTTAVDTTANIFYSTDGINWRPARNTVSRNSVGASISSIAYGRDENGRGIWVVGATTAFSSLSISILYSYNGMDWVGVSNSGSTVLSLNIRNGMLYNPLIYLDATNSNSYNTTTNTWTNMGSLGGNVVMTNMGTFDAADNGGSFNFNGSSNFGRLTTSSTSFSNVTYVAVVKPSTVDSWNIILSLGYWNPTLNKNLNQLEFYGTSPAPSKTSSFTFATNTWYVVASTHNSSTGAVTFYVNGVVVQTSTVATGSSWSGTIFTIGTDTNNNGYFWNGKIASVAIYNRDLTATEILSLSQSFLGTTSIAYGLNASTGRGLWIAGVNRMTADGNAFVVSTNGRDGWTAVSNTKAGLFDVTSGGPTSISYLNGVWYATGSSAGISTGRTLAYSYDGSGGWFGVYPTTNIYGAALTTFSLTDMRCVATTNDYMIPSGASSGTAAASFQPASMKPVRSIGWTAGVGSAYLQQPTLLFGVDGVSRGAAISADGGRTWGSSTVSLARSAFRGGVCNDAFWNGTLWGAVGHDAVSGSKVATSKDGVTWTQTPALNVPIKGVLNTITWNGSVWMVGGDGAPINDANTASIAWSADLVAWNGILNTDISLTVVKRIAWNGMYWVAVGQGGTGAGTTTIMYSKNRNGLVWEDTFTAASGSTAKTSTITTAVNDVVWGGGRWVAVGRGNSIAGGSGVSILYSVDTPAAGADAAEYAVSGRRWTGVASSAQLFPYGANSVSWNGKRFIATGPAADSSSTSNIIAWSADGISWNAYSSAKTVAPGQRWVAVGSGSRACIALSADGRVWTDVAGSAALFSDISGASAALVSAMKTGARAVGWNGSSLIVGGARSATTMTTVSQSTATSTIGRTTIPVCAFIGSGNGVLGGGTTNVPDASFQSLSMRTSSSVFITHMDVNMREASAPWANMWLNTYTDLSATQLFQVTPESQTFSSALKWNGWSWVANFGLTTSNPVTGEQYGSIWYCTDPLARVGWSVASNSANSRILIGQGGYAALEWNGVAWLACGNDPNNNNLIYTTDKYGAIGWTAVSGIASGGSASFQPVCIASSSRFWVVGGSQGTTSALYFTSDRTGATGWRAISTTGGGNVLPGIRISSVSYNGTAWICCGGGGGGSGAPASSISWRADTGANEDIGTGWATAGVGSGIPPVLSNGSAVMYNTGAASPMWVVAGNVTSNTSNQIAYTTTPNGSTGWNIATGTLTDTSFGRLTGIAWTGYSWIATSSAGASRILNTTDITAATGWNSTSIFSPTISTNAVMYANIPISLLTTGMPTSAGAGSGTGAMWRAGAGRAQGLLPGGGTETTSVVVRSSNGAEGTSWSQTYARNFLIAVGGGAIRDAANGGGANRMAYSYDGGLSWTTNTSTVLTNAASSAVGSIRTVKYGNGMWVAGGDAAGSSVSGNNCLAWSRDGVNWTGAGGTQIFGSAGGCYAVCCNDRGRWVAVGGAALTTPGTYTNTSGAIYTMAWSDDGMNWTPILGSRALFGIVCQGVSYGADASGVGMWTAIGRGTAYTGCAYSYDGKTWFLSQTSGSLFGTSVNVLTERYAPVADWRTVAINSTGQIQFAAAQGGLVWRSMDCGVTWSALTLPSRNWVSVAVSSTGQYVVAASSDGSVDRLYNSSDYGVTWVGRGYGSPSWVRVVISASGQYQVGVASGVAIQISRDYGVTWVVPNSITSAQDWNGVAISSSGQYITAVGNGQFIQQSSDYGVSFTARSSAWNWSCVAMSSTGQIQIGSNNNSNLLYVSINYGVDWTPSSAPSGTRYRSVAISSTGQYRSGVLETASGTIKRSNNYDAGWITDSGPSTNYFAIAMSSTGQYQTAVSQTASGLIYISSNFGETWSAAATDSRSLGVAYGKDANGTGMWVATAGRRDRDVAASAANTMAYSYDGKLWRGIRASAGLSEQAWSVAYGKDGFGVGMWVAAGYDSTCGLKWSYDGITWNASMGASGAAVWAGMAAGRRALSVYWNGSMWLASTSDTRNGSPSGTGIAANNASSAPGYLLYSYNGKNWLPVLAPNTYAATISASAQPSVYSVLPNPAILDFGSFYDDQAQRGVTIANTTARTVGAIMSGVPVENVNTIVPYGKGSLTTGQVPFLLGGDSGLVETAAGVVGVAGASAPPPTSELASTTASLSTSTDGGITWRAVPNSTRVMTKVNKIQSDETTQQIVAVGTGNYSVATSTPATAANADGWVGVFGSRMTDTRAGLFEKYGTGASWFGGAKMWIASGRAQSRRGSSLAVSVNGTVWQDAKIVTATAAGGAGAARGGGLVSRTTTSLATLVTGMNSQDGASAANSVTVIPGDALYDFSSFTFNNAGQVGREGPNLTKCRTYYAANRTNAAWTQDIANNYLNMTTNGIQLWKVPATGSYTIRAAGATGGVGGGGGGGRGIDVSLNITLLKGDVIQILCGQEGRSYAQHGSGGGGTFVVNNTTLIIAAGGGGGRVVFGSVNTSPHASIGTSGKAGYGAVNGFGSGGSSGGGGFSGYYSAGGGGTIGNGADNTKPLAGDVRGGLSFNSGGLGGSTSVPNSAYYSEGGFGGGGASAINGGGGGGGYSGGGGGGGEGEDAGGGGGGSFGITTLTNNGESWIRDGFVTITANFPIIATTTVTVNTPQTSYPLPTLGGIVPYNYLSMTHTTIPYTSTATPLLTYTDSAAAFSTQVSGVATNSQYNRAVVGGSGVQFVAGGRGAGSNGNGLAYSNDGQNWTAAAAGTSSVFQSPTNVAAYSTAAGSGGFDASFGTVALTQRMTTPTTYPSADFRSVSVSKTGQYQSAVISGGNIWTSSDYGVTWTSRATALSWNSVSLSSTGQYQSATVNGGFIWTSSDYGVTWTSRATSSTWNSVSLSSTGQYQTAAVSASFLIWASSDYGVTWTSRANTSAWVSVSLSSTGQYQAAVATSAGDIWISSDFGVSWSLRSTGATRNWQSVSLSSTGQYQTAVVSSGNIWTSSDYGVTWTERTTGATRNWYSVSISSTGQYQTAGALSGNIWTSYDFGVTWTSRATSLRWVSVSLSSTGQYQSSVVDGTGNIWTSTNYGATWVQRSTVTTTKAFTRIRSSASGQYQLATAGPVGNTNGQFYVSSDYGQTWIPRRGLGSWLGGTVSATGAIMMTMTTSTAATATLLRSTDYGNTFSDIGGTALTGSAYWRAISATNSAVFQTAVANGGAIYRSFDTGLSWTNAGITIDGSTTANTTTPRNWMDVAVSAETGTYQLTCISGGYIYYSTNRGDNWISSTVTIDGVATQTTNRNWQAVANSADGKYGLACVNSSTATGFLYRSENFGSTWVSNNISIAGAGVQTLNNAWQDVGMSANGKYQVACLNSSTLTSQIFSLQSALSVMVPPSGALASAFGTSWTKRGDDIDGEQSGDQSGYSISLSADGTVVAVGAPFNAGANGVDSGHVRVYAWSGSAWTKRGNDIDGSATGDLFGTSVSISANGNTLAVGAIYYDLSGILNRGQVLVYDWTGGPNWTPRGANIMYGEGADDYSGMSVSLSKDGNTVAIGAPMNNRDSNFIDSGHVRVYRWSGTAWVQRGADIDGGYGMSSSASNNVISKTANTGSRAWSSIAMSYSGQYQTATVLDGFIYVSHNYGLDWIERATSKPWRDVAMSANGRFQTAVTNTNLDSSTGTGSIYRSTDYGLTWTIVPGWDRTFSSVALSGTGQYQRATYYDSLMVSANYGQSWDTFFITISGIGAIASINFKSVAISYSGAIIAVVAKLTSKIFISYDYGATWSEKFTSINGRTKIAMSSSGQYMIADNGTDSIIITSSNFGENWDTRGGGQTPTDVAISPNGEYCIVPCLSNYIMYCYNYFNGITATSGSSQLPANAAALSENGKYGSMTTNGSYMVFSSSFPGSTGSFNNDNASYEVTKGDQSGTSVSLSADGNVVAIGAPYSDSSANIIDRGQVRVWYFDTGTSAWVKRGDDIFGEATNNQSGFSVSMSADGNTVAIGAPYNNGANGIDSGHVRVHKWNGTAWNQVGTVDIDGEAGLPSTPTIITGSIFFNNKQIYSVAMSDNGQYLSFGDYNNETGSVYTSYDYGVNWLNRTGSGLPAIATGNLYYNMAMSSTGKYQSVTRYTDGVYISSNYGYSWQKAASSPTHSIFIAMNNNGRYQTLSSPLDGVYVSSNYGVTWDRKLYLSSASLGKIAINTSGQYQTVICINAAFTISCIYRSQDYGENWTPIEQNIKRNWQGIAMSADGRLQTAVTSGGNPNADHDNRIYRSNDYGATWTPLSTPRIYNIDVAMSYDGRYQTILADSQRIHISTNFGATWFETGISVATHNNSLKGVRMSSTGQYQVVSTSASSPSLFFSRDFGYTWSSTPSYETNTAGDQSGYSLSLSADGNSLAVGAPYNDGTSGADRGHIRVFDYNTTNQTWPQRGTDNDGEAAGDLAGWSVSMSADGSTVAFGAPMNDGSGNALPNIGSVRVFNTPVTNAITYTSATPSVAEIAGNLIIIKANGTSAITATQGATTTNGSLSVSGTSYTLTYSTGTTSPTSYIYYSKNYGSSWSVLDTTNSRAWSSVAISENGSTISATASDASGAILTYSMPDDQYYRPPALTNSGSSTTTATVRAITYGNSGTGAATDGYWVAGADASANSLAYSSNGMDWTAVVGSKTTLFNAVNGVAYGADAQGMPMWVAVGQPFVGSVPGTTTYSIAYSYNMTTWTGVRNTANFTGQGNHVAYGQDEFGEGIWVAVGQGDDTRAFNLGNSSFCNSGGTPNTTIFYSYDGANWAAGTGLGIFAVSGTDVTWGVDASGVATWVATGVGFTDPLTGVFNSGGQVAHSLNGRVWTLISRPTAIIAPTTTTLSATTRGSAMIAPPASKTGFIVPTYNNIWRMLGADIDGEAAADESGFSVSISADGTIVAIGAKYNDGSGNLLSNSGHVRVYKYNPNKTVAQLNQNLPGFGPAGWDRLGGDIDGEAPSDNSGYTVSLSADGTTVAIGARLNSANGSNAGHVRIYKYRAGKTDPQLTNSAATATDFGPAGWDRVGGDIDGEAGDDQSGHSVSLSADGNVVAIGAYLNSNSGYNTNGHVRVYNYNPTKTTTPVKWEQLGADIDGELGGDQSGFSVSLSADGTTVAIGSIYNTSNAGHVRVYKYTPGKAAVTVQTDLSFGPAGWTRLGADIDGEAGGDYSGFSVSLSADGTTVAIGALYANMNDSGHVRVYKYTPGKAAVTSQTDLSFGPVGWTRLGADIDGEAGSDSSGLSVSLSADGTVVAIGANQNDGPTTNTSDDRGHVRVYKYNPAKIAAITDQTLPNFGPAGWDRIGVDIDGEAAGDQSGYSVSLSADGTTLAIGANTNDGAGATAGHVRVYKLDTYGAITYTSSNPAVANIYGNALLLINDISDGVTTITATQAAVPPFTLAPITVQGTLTVSGKTTRTLVYNSIISTYTPFLTSALTVAYGRAGSQGTGAPRWIVGGSGTNVFAISSRPSAITGTWSVVASNDPIANAPFPVCNSLGYSNGVWVAGNNTDATNVVARSIDGGTTWTPVTASSVGNIIAGATAVGANAFCNYSLAVADYSNDTNLRSWVAVQGTKNFMFDGGVSAVATVTPDVSASAYNGTNRAWWVAGGRNQFVPQQGQTYLQIPGSASIAYTADPSGATGWTLGTSTTNNSGNGIGDLEEIRDVAFSPHTQNWLAAGVGSAATPTRTALYSSNGMAWTSAVVSSTDASLNLNTCAWNQLDASASSAGRWLVGGARSGVDASAVSLFISSDVSGQNWTPLIGTGAILSQVYSLAYNGRVWIAAGTPATSNGSTSTLMRTTDPAGAAGWQGIAATNISTSGFDTAARSVTWNADQNMWVATGENTGSVADASFSSVIYSLDVSGSAGTWRTVRETNSLCFSGEGTGIAFTGDKWFASGEGNNQIVATTGPAASAANAASWTPIAHGTALTRASDIAYTGSRLIATGASTSGSTNGVILSTDNSGGVWSAAPATPGPAFTDALGGATSITFEASYEGVGRAVATGRSATNALSVSTDGGTTWSAPSVQYSTLDASFSATTQPLFTTGGNSVAYVGNDTIFAGGGNDVQWTGKRWVATGRNSSSSAVAAAVTSTAATATPLPDIINNNTSAVATSDDGMTWQCVSASQAPNLSEGAFLASNPRIGATPLINSQIVIADGGDTESSVDYGGMVGDMGGSGTGVAQIDIIAELTPVSTAASSVVSGAVNILGTAGNVPPSASFDNTAFTITTRPM